MSHPLPCPRPTMTRVPRLPLLPLAALVLTVSACVPPNRSPESAVAPHARAQHGQREQQAERGVRFRRVRDPDHHADAHADSHARAGEEGPEAPGGHGPAAAPAGSRDPSAGGLRMPSPGGIAWERVSDGGPDAAVVGACQKTDLETIGAVSAVRRSFASAANSAAATQVVAEFADEVGVAGARGAPRLAGGLRGAAGLRPQGGRSARWSAPGAASYRTDYGPQSAERTGGRRGWGSYGGAATCRSWSSARGVGLPVGAGPVADGGTPHRAHVRLGGHGRGQFADPPEHGRNRLNCPRRWPPDRPVVGRGRATGGRRRRPGRTSPGRGRALTADGALVQDDDPVQPDFARAALAVPVAGADVHPLPTRPGLLGGIPVVVLAGEHQSEPRRLAAAHEQHRPVLAAAVVLLVGDPGPDDLTGVGAAVCLRRVGATEGRAAHLKARSPGA